MDHIPFIIKFLASIHYEINFKFDLDRTTSIPLWIALLGLPVGYWSNEVMIKIASVIGSPLHIG